jgi:predicted nucleic-acid-binding Zn-ribbon protein
MGLLQPHGRYGRGNGEIDIKAEKRAVLVKDLHKNNEQATALLTEKVRRALPDLKCLRCSHQSFYLKLDRDFPMSDAGFEYKEVHVPTYFELVCRQCGFTEKHESGIIIHSAECLEK